MSIGPHVFGDDRLGLWFMNPAYLDARLPKVKELGFTDIFLPRTATKADIAVVQKHMLLSQLWFTQENFSTDELVNVVHNTLTTLGTRAVELNIEFGNDALLEPYMRKVVVALRKKRPQLRMRLNIATFKARFLPIDLVMNDPQLFVSEGCYFGNMDGMASIDDVRRDMIDAGVPLEKGSICFAAACSAPESSSFTDRIPTLPALSIKRMRKGIVFQDDLMAQVGIL